MYTPVWKLNKVLFCISENKNTCFNLSKFVINELDRMLGIIKAVGCVVDILISGKGKRFFQTSSGADPAYSSLRIGILFPGLNWLGCEADHLPPYSSKVKNECSSTTSTIRLCVVSYLFCFT